MALRNRRQSSLHSEAKAGLSSLSHQIGQGLVGLLAVLLLTGGTPSRFTVGLTFCAGVIFFAWKEKQRIEVQEFAEFEPSPQQELLSQGTFVIQPEKQEEWSVDRQVELAELEGTLRSNLSVLTRHKLEKLAEIELKKLVAIENAIALLSEDHPEDQDSPLEQPNEKPN